MNKLVTFHQRKAGFHTYVLYTRVPSHEREVPYDRIGFSEDIHLLYAELKYRVIGFVMLITVLLEV